MPDQNRYKPNYFLTLAGIEIRDRGSFIELTGAEGQPLAINPESGNKITVKRIQLADTIIGQELKRRGKLRRGSR